jgi:molybdate transport system substrate-binding protein
MREREATTRRVFLLGVGGATLSVAAGCKRDPGEVVVAAAASLRQVFPALASAFSAASPGPVVRATFGASGDLAKQIQGGAPIDAVLFASGKPVDALVEEKLVEPESRVVVATNRLVLVGPRAGGLRPALTFETLERLPDGERLAIGDPGAVPAGQYAKEALVALGKWSALERRVVLGGDVSAVLAYARRGEVKVAVVYETEIVGVDDVVVLDRAAGAWAPKPEVVAGIVAGGTGKERARSFVAFTRGDEGKSIFARFGFGAP